MIWSIASFPAFGCLYSSRKPRKLDICVELDIDNFYQRLRSPEQIQKFFGLPLIYTGEGKEKWWPCLVTILMECPLSLLRDDLTGHAPRTLIPWSVTERADRLEETNRQTELRCRFGRYIEEFFVLVTDLWKVFPGTAASGKHLSRRKYRRKNRNVSGLRKGCNPGVTVCKKRDRSNHSVKSSRLYSERVLGRLKIVIGMWVN